MVRPSRNSNKMANEEHVRLIKEGSEAWNAWSQINPGIAPELSLADLSLADLFGAKLRLANLSGAKLNGANLSSTDLSGANLRNAYLPWANLKSADLSGANLCEAYLNEANLSKANLSGADLSGADLTWADLSWADLSEANFSEARLAYTGFTGNDLRTIKGLETVRHRGPSTVSVDTLYKSDGKIPEIFLRGVGLPEGFITYLPSLIAQPIQFYSCFISYSHADQSFARRLHDTLQGRGIRCWLDEHQLLPGDKIYTEVDRGIRLWDKVLLCCSKDALTSWWVDNEIKIAFETEQQLWRERKKEVLKLIPLNLDDYLFGGQWQSGLASEVKARMAASFSGWEHDNKTFEQQVERLVKALRTDTARKERPPTNLI